MTVRMIKHTAITISCMLPVLAYGQATTQKPQPPSPPIATAADSPVPEAVRQQVERIARSIGEARFQSIAEQREAVEFLWTPGELLRQVLDSQSRLAYPEE